MQDISYQNKKAGFTLIELLVAVAIMATLIAIIMPNLIGARERARDAQKVQDLGAMRSALRLYYNDHQQYPAGVGGTLGAVLNGYMNQAQNLGYTYDYFQTDNGDGFVACVGLEAGGGNEDTSSQIKCGVEQMTLGAPLCGLSAGVTGDRVFAVCAR